MKCGLIGKTLKHSYSPQIHSMLGGYTYDLIELKDEVELENFVKNGDYDAYNVTIPYKKAVIKFLDVVSPLAIKIGAVNTVVKKDGKLYGYNTDFWGMKFMLSSAGINLDGKKVMILGSGGTSNTARVVASECGAKEVVIVSRTGDVNYQNCYDLTDTEVIINTTPVGMYPDSFNAPIDVEKFKNLTGVADVIYNPSLTKLAYMAKQKGIATANGLSMLVAQAKYARDLFLGFSNKGFSDDNKIISPVVDDILRETNNIILIGMPGSGKSTVGKKLADLTGKKFIDTDELIVKTTNKSIPEIFSACGEEVFRDLEEQALKTAVNERSAIIATGGGIIKREKNHYLLSSNGKVVWLQRDLFSLSTKDRPLSKSVKELEKIYLERKDLYRQCADITIVNDKSVNEIAKEIANRCEYLL